MEAWSNLKKKTAWMQKSQSSETKTEIKSEIFYNLVPTFFLNKMCGLLPVKFTHNEDPIKNSKIDPSKVIYGFLLASALVAFQCWGLYRDMRDGWENSTRLFSKRAVTVTGSDVFFVMSVTAFSILDSPSRWGHIRGALDKIVQADEKLNIATSTKLRKKSIILILCSLGYLMSISTLDYISWGIIIAAKKDYKFNDKSPINYSPLYLMYTVVVSLQLQYAIILMNLGERFTKLNLTIEKLTKTNAIIDYFRKDMGLAAQDSQREIPRPFVSPDLTHRQLISHRSHKVSNSTEDAICGIKASKKIDELIIVHDMLCDSVAHMNKAYGLSLLLCTLSCLIHLIITLYFLYAEINSPNSRWYVFMRQIGWIIFHIYKMFLFSQPPFMVAMKARNTGSLVSQALASDWNPQARKELEKFSMQLLNRPVEFTSCGLFGLDRGLMTSIAGAVTTYLVILVQFQDNDDKEARELLLNATTLLRNLSGIGIGDP